MCHVLRSVGFVPETGAAAALPSEGTETAERAKPEFAFNIWLGFAVSVCFFVAKELAGDSFGWQGWAISVPLMLGIVSSPQLRQVWQRRHAERSR